MRSRVVLSVLIPIAVLTGKAFSQQATIEHTASTNMAGVKLVVNSSGAAEVQPRDAQARQTTIDAHLCERLFQDLKAVGPLSSIPPVRCMKSVSFGFSLYIEFNGERSPDLSCPAPPDSKIGILKKDVDDLMKAAGATPHIRPRFTANAPPK